MLQYNVLLQADRNYPAGKLEYIFENKCIRKRCNMYKFTYSKIVLQEIGEGKLIRELRSTESTLTQMP